MGSINKLLKNWTIAGWMGAFDEPKTPSTTAAATSANQELAQEKEDTSKKRKALYETQGGVLGQEVSSVGNSKRGSIFGN